jgi:hypothetical protein
MLNLNRQEQILTQGRPVGERFVARPAAVSRAVEINEMEVTPEPDAQPSGQQNQAGGVNPQPAGPGQMPDPRVVARGVYELMQRDLRLNQVRRGSK